MKKIISVIMCIAMLSSLIISFSACKKDDGDTDEVGYAVSDFKIVYSERASDDIKTAANAIKNRINESAKVSLTVKDDWTAPEEDTTSSKEILIGRTNRAESIAALEKLNTVSNEKAYIIEASENKIVILGKSDDITIRALKYFATNFVSTSQKEGTLNIEAGYSKGGVVNTSTTILYENLVEFSYGKKHVVFGNYKSGDSRVLSYPKMIQLQYQKNETDNGMLIATLNASESYYPIVVSRDDGETWTEIANVFDTLNKDKKIHGGRMPFLYEMPVDMGDFKKGDIILAGTSSDGNKGTVNLTTITFYVSRDLGKTWTTLYNIDYGGAQFYPANKQVDLGVWEPYLIYDNGRIYCFYSDDSDPEHDQKLVYKYTTDMKNWVGKDGIVGPNGANGDPFEIVCCEDKDYRPGMISVVKMNNGEYLAVYDIVVYAKGRPNGQIEVDGKIYKHSPDLYKKSTSLDKWDIADPGTVPMLSDGRYMGLSPWVAYSPTIGETGMLVIYGRTWASTDKSQTNFFLSFDYGETYVELENPFEYTIGGIGPNGKTSNYGYSPALFFSADGKSMYFAVNKINDYKTGYSVELVKIDIIY